MKLSHFRILFLLLLAGCAANPFTQYYRDQIAGATAEEVVKRLMPYSGATKLFTTKDHEKDGRTMIERGYVLIGESAFEGAASVTAVQLVDQGKAVGADIILYSSRYEGDTQVAMPFMQYNPGLNLTTFSSGTANANAYGTGGYAHGTANYSSYTTTTSPGTFSTTVVPITVQRYAHGATFWRKARPAILGVLADSLPDDMRRRLQRNTGALVKIVADDSPAFRANLLPGDIVTGIDEEEIISARHLVEVLPKYAGRRVTITLLRDGTEKKFSVQLNQNP